MMYPTTLLICILELTSIAVGPVRFISCSSVLCKIIRTVYPSGFATGFHPSMKTWCFSWVEVHPHSIDIYC